MQTQEPSQNDITNETEKPSAKSVCCGIYGLQNKLKPEKWYVGQSVDVETRWGDYKSLNCKGQRKLYNALLKYGYENFNKVILERCESEMTEKEDKWIDYYDSIKRGYNLRRASSHGKHSDETKIKMSITATGKKKSPSHVANLPQNTKGWKQPKELIEKRAKALRKPKTEEHRKHIKEAMNRLRPKKSREEVLARRRELYSLRKLEKQEPQALICPT